MDPMLSVALLVAVGMTVTFFRLWRHEAKSHACWFTVADFNTKRRLAVEARLADTEAALHAKVAAETRGGDGPVAA